MKLFVLGMILDTISLCFRAIVIKLLWTWFIVYQFAALPKISFEVAFGIALLFAAIEGISRYSLADINELKNANETELLKGMIFNWQMQMVSLIIFISFGFLIHLGM